MNLVGDGNKGKMEIKSKGLVTSTMQDYNIGSQRTFGSGVSLKNLRRINYLLLL